MEPITRRQFLALALGAIITAAAPEPAEAMPRKFRNCPKVTQNGVTYLLYQSAAIVTKAPARKSVTIPDKIKSGGRTYTVRAVWDGAISGSTRRLVLKARHLETIEDARAFSPRLVVICYDKATYQWLHRGGANARKHF